jgi:hypothetical protein
LLEILDPPPIRGRREYRVRAAPTVSCAKLCTKTRTRAYRSAETLRHSLRSGFTAYLYRALPGVPSLIATVIGAALSCQLDTSVGVSGPHDFAVRITRFRQRRLLRPPLPVPTFEDDRERPSGWDGMADDIEVIWVSRQAKNFGNSEVTTARPRHARVPNISSPAGRRTTCICYC